MSLSHYMTSDGDVFAKKTSSPSGDYYVIHHDAMYHEGVLEPGRAWVFGPSGELFSVGATQRPKSIAVANNGNVIIGDWMGYSTPSAWIRVFDVQGRELFSKRGRQGIGGVGISPGGSVAVYGQMGKPYTFNVIDALRGEVMATIKRYGVFSRAEISDTERIARITISPHDDPYIVTW